MSRTIKNLKYFQNVFKYNLLKYVLYTLNSSIGDLKLWQDSKKKFK